MDRISRAFTVHKPLSKYPVLFALILLTSTCIRKPEGERTEGKIKFRITYEQGLVGGYSTTVLPKEMIMAFSNDMVRNTIEGGLGFFSLVNVSDLRNYQNTTWLKFIDKKYIYIGDKKEKPCCFGMLEGMVLTFTDSTKEITGMECKHAIASFPDNGIKPFNIWYTQEIGLYNPNGNTPYRDIQGVLLEFNTLMGNSNMHMVATSYEAHHIPQKHFQPPRNFRPVTKDEMDRILYALMN